MVSGIPGRYRGGSSSVAPQVPARKNHLCPRSRSAIPTLPPTLPPGSRGEYEPGAKLASYSQLADLYSVSFSTAARAVALLRDRGIVIGAPGRGVFVADRASRQSEG